jgi:hypothetical protein
MKGFLNKLLGALLLGTRRDAWNEQPLYSAVARQRKTLMRIWRNDGYQDFGIERLIRLLLVVSQFVFPGLYIKEYFGRFGHQWRMLGVEFYVLAKLVLPLLLFKLNLTGAEWALYLMSYMMVETILYLTSLIYLTDVLNRPSNIRRSTTLMLINYVELGLEYAVLYSYFSIHIPDFFAKPLSGDLDAIYFSFVTSATVGYGDNYPVHETGRMLVITQLFLFLVFVGLFVNFFTTKIHDVPYSNEEDING